MLNLNIMPLLVISVFMLGFPFGIIIYLASNKKNTNITEFFSNNKTYLGFIDQSDPCIDDVVKDFKLLDD